MADQSTTTAAPGTGAPGTALAPVVQSGAPVMHQDTSLPAVIRRNVQVLRPIADGTILLQVQNEARSIIQQLLKDGKDYGTVPGVSKPSLLKPGAEKVNGAYGLVARFIVVEKEVDHYQKVDWSKPMWVGSGRNRKKETVAGTSHGLYRYVINCELVDRGSGEVMGSSLGSCSTLESKYIDRPRDLENTIIKMAEKRAYIGATLLTHGLSEQFTQDVEDTGVASDDTQAIAVQEPEPPGPEVGSAEWAITYEIPENIRKKLKLADDVTTMGQLAWKQLDAILAGVDALLRSKPDHPPFMELKRAVIRMQEELEERNVLGVEVPGQEKPAAAESTTEKQTEKPYGLGEPPPAPPLPAIPFGAKPAATAAFNPLAADGGGVASDENDGDWKKPVEPKDLPF